MKNIKVKVINAIFGLDDTATLGQIEWALFQSAAAFPEFYVDFNTMKGMGVLFVEYVLSFVLLLFPLCFSF